MDYIWELIFSGGPLGIAAVILGALCSLAVLVGLVHSLVSKSRGWTLGWAAIALVGGATAGVLSWIQAGLDRDMVRLAVSDGWAADLTTLALMGHYESMRAVEVRLWLLLLPLGLGAFLLVRGLMLPGGDEPTAESSPEAPGRGALYATVGCITAGCGLALWAIADVNHFGAYVMALLMVL